MFPIKFPKKYIERSWSGGIKPYIFKIITSKVFSIVYETIILFLVFYWLTLNMRDYDIIMNFKNRYLNIWGGKVLNLILGYLIESYIRGKIPDHYLSLSVAYLALSKSTFSHCINRWSQACLLDGNHCALSVWSKGVLY